MQFKNDINIYAKWKLFPHSDNRKSGDYGDANRDNLFQHLTWTPALRSWCRNKGNGLCTNKYILKYFLSTRLLILPVIGSGITGLSIISSCIALGIFVKRKIRFFNKLETLHPEIVEPNLTTIFWEASVFQRYMANSLLIFLSF